MIRLPEKKNCDELRKVFDRSLHLMGDRSRKLLLSYFSREFDFSFRNGDCPEVRDIENALESVLGTGAYIVLAEMQKNLERLGSAKSRK